MRQHSLESSPLGGKQPIDSQHWPGLLIFTSPPVIAPSAFMVMSIMMPTSCNPGVTIFGVHVRLLTTSFVWIVASPAEFPSHSKATQRSRYILVLLSSGIKMLSAKPCREPDHLEKDTHWVFLNQSGRVLLL